MLKVGTKKSLVCSTKITHKDYSSVVSDLSKINLDHEVELDLSKSFHDHFKRVRISTKQSLREQIYDSSSSDGTFSSSSSYSSMGPITSYDLDAVHSNFAHNCRTRIVNIQDQQSTSQDQEGSRRANIEEDKLSSIKKNVNKWVLH